MEIRTLSSALVLSLLTVGPAAMAMEEENTEGNAPIVVLQPAPLPEELNPATEEAKTTNVPTPPVVVEEVPSEKKASGGGVLGWVASFIWSEQSTATTPASAPVVATEPDKLEAKATPTTAAPEAEVEPEPAITPPAPEAKEEVPPAAVAEPEKTEETIAESAETPTVTEEDWMRASLMDSEAIRIMIAAATSDDPKIKEEAQKKSEEMKEKALERKKQEAKNKTEEHAVEAPAGNLTKEEEKQVRSWWRIW